MIKSTANSWQASTAKLNWDKPQTPVATDFDDVYFSEDDCLGEVDYVFLQANQLQQRFLKNHYQQSHRHKHHFIIAETGFGTGLNFLLTLKLWLESPISQDKQLHFVSVEQFPLSLDALKIAHALWPELSPLANILQQHYPDTLLGLHYRECDFSQIYPNSLPVKLSLLFNEAQTGFAELFHTTHNLDCCLASQSVDAWFLDGFSPSKNPEMWQDGLFALMARLSHKNTSLATFTAAGFVKRGLKQAGFRIKKHKGFGRKRDMLIGQFVGLPSLQEHIVASTKKQTFGDFWPIYRPQLDPLTSTTQDNSDCTTKRDHKSLVQTVSIIGAGVAGLTTAYQLAQAGFIVDVFESNDDSMQEASGNPQAVLFPKLSVHKTALSEFNLLSLNYAVDFYQRLNKQHIDNADLNSITNTALFEACGLIQCVGNESQQQLQELAQCFPQFIDYLNAKQASQLANTKIQSEAIHYPKLGFVNTQTLKQHFLNHSNIHLHTGTKIEKLQKITQEDTNHWRLEDSNKQQYTANYVVVCNANAAQTLLPQHSFSLKNIRGQITQITRTEQTDVKSNLQTLPSLKKTVCHKAYINPAIKKHNETHIKTTLSFGASFDLHNNNPEPEAQSDQYNIKQLHQHLPDFKILQKNDKPELNDTSEHWHARVNFRCTSNDYLPIVGPVINETAQSNAFNNYRKNSHAHIPSEKICHQGLFVNIAYGSRGFTTAPISAATIISYLTQGLNPLPCSLIKAVHPGRFYIKNIKQANKQDKQARINKTKNDR